MTNLQRHWGDFVAALPMPALILGDGGQVVAANRSADLVVGADLQGRHFITALRQPALLDAIEAALRDRLPRKAPYRSSDVTLTQQFDVHISPIGPDGSEFLLCMEDVTALQGARAVRRDFVANVSHELRTPLTAILGFIETLQGPAREDAAALERFLGLMGAEAERMNRLIQDLLSLSRVEQNERLRPSDKVEIVGLIKSVQHRLAGRAEQADAEVVLEPGLDEVHVPADSDQLMQVFTNLIENAIKYGGGQIVIDLSLSDYEPVMRGPAITVDVKDNGEGIDPLDIPRLTERFYRVDSHRARTMGGTGLGLAIVKHIVSRHRGRLRIQSVLGQGSSFAVTLPIFQQDRE